MNASGPSGPLVFKINVFAKKSGIPSVSNSLDSGQAGQNVGPDLGSNCLQRLSADDFRIVKSIIFQVCEN